MNTFYTIRRQMLIIQGTKLDIFLPLQYDVGVQFQQREMRDLVQSTLLSLNWHFERDDLLSQQNKLGNCLAT